MPVQLQEVFSPSHSHSLADLYSSGLLTVDEQLGVPHACMCIVQLILYIIISTDDVCLLCACSGVRASGRGLSLLDSLLPHLMACLNDRLQGH